MRHPRYQKAHPRYQVSTTKPRSRLCDVPTSINTRARPASPLPSRGAGFATLSRTIPHHTKEESPLPSRGAGFATRMAGKRRSRFTTRLHYQAAEQALRLFREYGPGVMEMSPLPSRGAGFATMVLGERRSGVGCLHYQAAEQALRQLIKQPKKQQAHTRSIASTSKKRAHASTQVFDFSGAA